MLLHKEQVDLGVYAASIWANHGFRLCRSKPRSFNEPAIVINTPKQIQKRHSTCLSLSVSPYTLRSRAIKMLKT